MGRTSAVPNDLDGIDRKQCEECTKLLYLERFSPDPSELDGLQRICKRCHQELAQMEFCEEVMATIRNMDNAALNSLIALEGKAGVRDMISLPHAATLLEDIMTVWGGSLGFAQHMMAEYLAANPGSTMRHSTLKAIMALVKFVSEQNYVQQPLETMSDDQLDEHRDRIARELQQKLGVYNGESA